MTARNLIATLLVSTRGQSPQVLIMEHYSKAEIVFTKKKQVFSAFLEWTEIGTTLEEMATSPNQCIPPPHPTPCLLILTRVVCNKMNAKSKLTIDYAYNNNIIGLLRFVLFSKMYLSDSGQKKVSGAVDSVNQSNFRPSACMKPRPS